MIKALTTVVTAGILCACESPGLYSWGNYESDLYRYYHQADKRKVVVADHLAFIARLEHNGVKPAPGLYAEAGTFLLLQGEPELAIEYYQKEHDAWPESQQLMSKLITNLREQ